MDSSPYQKSDSIDPVFGVIHVYLPSTSLDKSTFLQILIVSGEKRKIPNQKLLKLEKVCSILERFDSSRWA